MIDINYNTIPEAIHLEDLSGATHTSIAYFRQNPWKTDTYNPYLTILSKKLHIPFAHGPSVTIANAPQQSQLGISLNIGDIVTCVYGSRRGLVVRITSEVKQGFVSPLYIASSFNEHYQSPADYDSGIQSVISKLSYRDSPGSLVDGVKWSLENNLILQPFTGLYRDIEILGIIDGVDDWRNIAGMASSGKRVTYYRIQPYVPPQVYRSITLGYSNGEVGPMG